MRPNVLILDNSKYPLLFHEDRSWRPFLRDADVTVVNVPSGKRIPPLEEFTHVLVSGSDASILEPRAWRESEAQAVRDAAAVGIPILGSCFGHQMLVYALSGSDHLRRSPVPEVGWITLEKLGDDELLRDAPNPWHTFSFHFDEAFDLPEPWRILARSAACPTQIIRYGDRPIWGIQGHPEMSPGKARAILAVYRLFAGRARRRLICRGPVPGEEDRVIGRVFARFLDQTPEASRLEAGRSGR